MKQFILFLVLISFIDMFSQLPIMSTFAKDLGASPALIGLTVGMYSFTNMFGNILAGYWIDRQGAKKVIILGFILTAAALLLYTIVNQPEQLAGVRFLHGLFSGLLVPAAFTIISNKGSSEKQGKSMAISGVAVGLSAIIGPAFGGIVASRYSVEWVFISISIAMLLAAILSFFILPRGNPDKITRKLERPAHTLLAIIKKPLLAISFTGAFALMFAQGVLAYMLPLQVQSLDYGSQFSGILLSTFGITAILIFGLPTNRLFDRYDNRHIMLIGMAVIGIALVMLSTSKSLPFLFLCMIIYGIGFAFLFPSISAMLVKNTDQKTRGKAFGLFYAFFSLGVVAGSAVTGILAVSYAGGFLIAAGILLINTIWMYLYFRNKSAVKERLEK